MLPTDPNPTGNANWTPPPPTLIVPETQAGDGTNPGHLAGTLASLAANASANVTYDLGYCWWAYPVVNVGVKSTGPSTGVTINLISHDTTDPTVGLIRSLNAATAAVFGILSSLITTSSGQASSTVRPQGRYLTVQGKNSDVISAQGSGSTTWLGMYCG